MRAFLNEFKQFAMRGNVVDMAIGIIIGTAFARIVASLVGDIIMPPLGLLVSDSGFTKLAITLQAGTEALPPVKISYGAFIKVVVDFLIIAWVIFLVMRGINRLKKKEEAQADTPAAPPAPSREEQLLQEIRDLLERQS